MAFRGKVWLSLFLCTIQHSLCSGPEQARNEQIATLHPEQEHTPAADNLRSLPSTRKSGGLSGNPAAITIYTGTGELGHLLGLPEDSPLTLGGMLLSDTNGLISGGAQPGTWLWNNLLIVSSHLDAEKLIGWKGATFGMEFLQFNGENTAAQMGTVQGYNSLDAGAPYARSQIYQLWYHQKIIDEVLSVRIGKMVPTIDFTNVLRPVPTRDQRLAIPAVSGLLYTPIFVNMSMLGAVGGYYNSVSGVVVNFTPTENFYINYGAYDGNVALGVQTGLMGPQFNGYYFHILEAGAAWNLFDSYPGQFAVGGWYQTGKLSLPSGISQNGTGGIYFFGSQRIWSGKSSKAEKIVQLPSGKKMVRDESAGPSPPSVTAFVQFGANDSQTLPVDQFFGMGLTAFNMVPRRSKDTFGAGMSWSWLNDNIFARPSELMFQGYYQAHLFSTTFFTPAVTYVPTPGVSADFGGAWAITFRTTVLF